MKSTRIEAEVFMPKDALTHIRQKHSESCKADLPDMHLSNFLFNVKTIHNYPGILGFEKIFKKTPAVIVGAGPSLDSKTVELLKKYRDNIIIISVDAALPVLVGKYDLYPHFVCMVDPTEKQKDNFKGIDTTKFYSIIPTVVHPSIFRTIDPQHLAVYSIKDSGSTLLELAPYHTGKIGALPAGVLTSGTCFAFAAIMGCNPLMFVGHSLSWPDTEHVYADGIDQKKIDFQKGAKFRGGCLLFPDIDGKLVLTHETFVVFWAWVNDMAHRMKQKVLNCSGAGILKSRDIKAVPFKDALKKYCSKELVGVDETIKKAYKYQVSDGYIEKLLTPDFKRI